MRGDGRIYSQRGSPYLYIGYFDGSGKEHRESTKTDDRKKAQKLLDQRLREVRNAADGLGTFNSPARKRVRMKEVFEGLEQDFKFREIKSLEHSVAHLTALHEFFDADRALAVDKRRALEFVEAQKALGRKPATINRKLELLKQALRLAEFPVPKVPALAEDNARQGFFEAPEFARVHALLGSPFADIAQIAYRTGWRRSEILGLRWAWIDRAAAEMSLPDSKNGKPRKIGIDDALSEIIERAHAIRAYKGRSGGLELSDYVFHANGRQLARRTLEKAFRKACIAAELPAKLFHDLRRTAVRNMVRAGISPTVAKKISGHKTDSMFERYNITATEDTREALRLTRASLEMTDESAKNPLNSSLTN